MNFIDIHSHLGGLEDSDITKTPTISVLDDKIFSYSSKFWSGLHPYEQENIDIVIKRLEQVCDRLLGVGEIGLDKFKGSENQFQLFEQQYKFAVERNLPITIHMVGMFNEVDKILQLYGAKKTIIHSFIGSSQMAKTLLNRGAYLSYGTRSLASTRTVETLKEIPLERLFLESDENGDIKKLYIQVSDILNIELEELKEQINKNYECLIG